MDRIWAHKVPIISRTIEVVTKINLRIILFNVISIYGPINEYNCVVILYIVTLY